MTALLRGNELLKLLWIMTHLIVVYGSDGSNSNLLFSTGGGGGNGGACSFPTRTNGDRSPSVRTSSRPMLSLVDLSEGGTLPHEVLPTAKLLPLSRLAWLTSLDNTVYSVRGAGTWAITCSCSTAFRGASKSVEMSVTFDFPNMARGWAGDNRHSPASQYIRRVSFSAPSSLSPW